MNSAGKTAAVVYNPIKVNEHRLRSLVEKSAQRYGWDSVIWKETSEDDPGVGQAQQAASEGADMVIACGGDGTVRAVAEGLHDSHASLGIIPQGTGNLLARNLKLPLEIHRAIDVAFSGQDNKIDLCTATLRREDGSEEKMEFAVMAGVGIDAQMIANTDDKLKKKVGYLAYGVAIVKSLSNSTRIKATVSLDGQPEEKIRVHSLIVGNCGELMGNVALLPDALANDGKFDVVALRPKGPLGWFVIMARLVNMGAKKLRQQLFGRAERVTGDGKDIGALQYKTGQSMDVTFKQPQVFEVDGDEVGTVTGFRIDIDHLALTVRESRPAPIEEPGEPTIAAKARVAEEKEFVDPEVHGGKLHPENE